MSEKLEADYLIVGSGAMGMAFADVLLTESDHSLIIVDRHHQPGGHWNDAYPYVRLHQPSAFYGVNSRHLGSDAIDATGWNKGLYELATNSEVIAYFDHVLQQQFLPSGRVRYFPNCEYTKDGAFHSLLSDATYSVQADKVVDATYMNVTVPSMRPPAYEVEESVYCLPPNALPRVSGQFSNYVVIGAGKTGMDACLFLLSNQVDPDRIRWIMPRDSWILDRANIQPGKLAQQSASLLTQQAIDLAEAEDFTDAFNRVEKSGGLIRFDPEIWPTMYRCATVTQLELEQLRRIKGVVRKGRVQRISRDTIHLDEADIPTDDSTLHIDCSADGLERRPSVPVFQNDRITLQSVRTCQQVFSAAFIGHVETAYSNDATRNELCTPVPHPDTDVDFLRTTLANGRNATRWAQDPELTAWLGAARLDGFSRPLPEAGEIDNETRTRMQELQALLTRANDNVERILQKVTEEQSI